MVLLILLCSLVTLYVFYYWSFTKKYTYWSDRNVPYEKPFFIFGNFYNIVNQKEHIFHTLCSIYDRFKKEPYVGMFTFNTPTLLINSPDVIKRILVKDFDKFMDRVNSTNEKVDPIAFHTLFSSKGNNWRALRSKLSPVFTSGKIKLMFPLMKECGENLVTLLERSDRKSTDINDIMKRYAIDVISTCAFGINGHCLQDENSEMHKVAIKLLDNKSFYRNLSMFCFFFMPKMIDIFRLTFTDQKACDYLMNVFKTTIKQRETKNIQRHDLIDLLNNLRSQDNENFVFDDMKMAAQAIVFFSAGNDTTANTLSFALHELSHNRECQDKLRKEVNKALENNNNEVSYEVVNGMKYLDMVIRETLRKYPLTSFLIRECKADYTFEETGITIEKGVSILIPVCGLHYDPDLYPDPHKFDPERFSDENKSTITPYTYLPFGEGPRVCIGERFAMIVVKTALVYAIRNFDFEKCKETTPMQISPRSLFLQNVGGIVLRPVKI